MKLILETPLQICPWPDTFEIQLISKEPKLVVIKEVVELVW